MAILMAIETYRTEPQDAWRRIKVRLKSKKQLAVLIAVAGWRELEAQEKNVPRSRVIKDDAVAEVATQMPQSKEALGQLRALPRGMSTSRIGDSLIRAVKEGLARDPATLPHTNWGREESSESVQAAAEILKLALKVVCEREGLAPKLVANTSDIEAIAESDDADVPLMHGWRREVFGNLALELKRGKAMIGFRDGRVIISPASG
jgi:ribonuclease D